MKHNGETQRSSLLSATLQDLPDQPEALTRARAFAQPLLMGATLDTGEDVLAHADAVAQILSVIGGSEAMQAACYLVYASEHLQKPEEVIAKAFGASYAELALETTRLIRVQRQARAVAAESQVAALQTENVRKMLLAFSRDLRVVMLRLASRLQTLRYFAASKGDPGEAMASARPVKRPRQSLSQGAICSASPVSPRGPSSSAAWERKVLFVCISAQCHPARLLSIVLRLASARSRVKGPFKLEAYCKSSRCASYGNSQEF